MRISIGNSVWIGFAVFWVTACSRGFFTTAQVELNPPGNLAVNHLTITMSNPTAGAPTTLENLNFHVESSSLPTGVVYLWSHALIVSGTNELQTCTTLGSDDTASYVLNCSQPGVLQVTVTISNQGVLLSSDSTNWNIETPTAPNQPSPTPSPTPSPLDGRALYQQSCSNCHGSITSSNISNRGVSGIENAISSVGAMRSLSSLSNAEILAISTSLNAN